MKTHYSIVPFNRVPRQKAKFYTKRHFGAPIKKKAHLFWDAACAIHIILLKKKPCYILEKKTCHTLEKSILSILLQNISILMQKMSILLSKETMISRKAFFVLQPIFCDEFLNEFLYPPSKFEKESKRFWFEIWFTSEKSSRKYLKTTIRKEKKNASHHTCKKKEFEFRIWSQKTSKNSKFS